MTAGVGFLGRDIDVSFGGSTIAGVTSKNISFTNSMVDSSTDTSSGWAEFLATARRKEFTVGFSGKVQNLSLLMSIINNTSQIYATTLTFPDGTTTNSTVTGDAAFTDFSLTGEHEDISTFDMNITFSGEVTFTAAT